MSQNPDHVIIFDTTLRDGEQAPGFSMDVPSKLKMAMALDELGVDIIEAGFPIASEGDFAAVHEIATRSKNAVICGLSRAAPKDIDRCAEAIKPAERGRIHTFLSTSPVHMKYKLQMEAAQVYEMVISSVTRARNHTDDVEWSAEDATRTEFDFLCRCIEAAIKEFQSQTDGVQVEAQVTGLRLAGIAFDSKTLRVIAEADGLVRALVTKIAVQ